MANPTIAASGSLSELILVTDADGVPYSTPKVYASFVDSSNSNVYRVDFSYGMHGVSLIFSTETLKNTFITDMRALY